MLTPTATLFTVNQDHYVFYRKPKGCQNGLQNGEKCKLVAIKHTARDVYFELESDSGHSANVCSKNVEPFYLAFSKKAEEIKKKNLFHVVYAYEELGYADVLKFDDLTIEVSGSFDYDDIRKIIENKRRQAVSSIINVTPHQIEN